MSIHLMANLIFSLFTAFKNSFMNKMDSNSLKFSKMEKYLVTALAGLQFIHTVDFMVLMPLGPILVNQFKISNEHFAYLVSAYTFAAGISALLASTFIDRFNRKKSLLVVFSGFLFSTLLCGFAHSFYMLLLARMITGIFGGLINSMVYSIIGDVFVYERRGSAMGIVMASFSAATVVGIPASLFLANRFSWNLPFISLFVLGFFLLIFAVWIIPAMPAKTSKHAYSEIFTNIHHYPAFFLTLSMMLGGFSVIPYISNYLVFNTVMTQADLPMMYLFGGGATYISSRVFGYLSDMFGKKRMFYIIAFASIIPVYLISHMDKTGSKILILTVTTMFFIFISGRWVPGMALITSSVKSHIRGSFMTVNAAIQQLTAAAATFIGGKIITQGADHVLVGYNTVSIFSIFFTLLSLLCVYLIKLQDGFHHTESEFPE